MKVTAANISSGILLLLLSTHSHCFLNNVWSTSTFSPLQKNVKLSRVRSTLPNRNQIDAGGTHPLTVQYSKQNNVLEDELIHSTDVSTPSNGNMKDLSSQPPITSNPSSFSMTSNPSKQEEESSSSFSTSPLSSLFLGIEPTPEIIAIMTIYFVEGALGLARLAQTFFLKDELHLGPAELSALGGLFTLPWTIKPLYGFLSDGLPLFGYRRRSYLILCGIVGSASYLAIGSNFGGVEFDSSTMLTASIVSLVVSSACIAFSDVVADGIVVQRTRDSDDPKVAGGLQSLCWGSAAIGGLISAYFSGSLLETMGPKDVFLITACLPALVGLIAFFIDEQPIGSVNDKDAIVDIPTESTESVVVLPVTSAQDNIQITPGIETSNAIITSTSSTPLVSEQASELWKAIQNPAVWRPALFLFLWQSTPTSEGAFLYFMTNDLHMGPEFLGRVRLVTAAASLLGVWGYQQYLRSVSIQKILLWTSIASAPLGLLQLLLITHVNRDLGIPDGAFVFGDDVVLAILGQFAFLPTLVLAARICPPGVESTLFATLMSIFNGAGTVGTEIGAVLTKYLGVTESNFDNLGLLTVICNVSSLFPLIFIGLLNGIGDKSEAEMENEDESTVVIDS